MQKKIRKLLKLISSAALLLFLGYLYLRVTTEPLICPRVERIFLGERYDVERCSGGGGDLHYFVMLRIYSKKDGLLGQRRFTVHTLHKNSDVEYLDDKIIYRDVIRDGEPGMPGLESKTLQFPLTRKDWFDANLDRILFSP